MLDSSLSLPIILWNTTFFQKLNNEIKDWKGLEETMLVNMKPNVTYKMFNEERKKTNIQQQLEDY
jgi:hypothetical protein